MLIFHALIKYVNKWFYIANDILFLRFILLVGIKQVSCTKGILGWRAGIDCATESVDEISS